jgi:hypothetical protein
MLGWNHLGRRLAGRPSGFAMKIPTIIDKMIVVAVMCALLTFPATHHRVYYGRIYHYGLLEIH